MSNSNIKFINRLQLLADIVEVFEDFLDERGIVLENEEKQEAIADGEDSDGIANVYGSDYGQLIEEVNEVLVAYRLFNEYEIPNGVEIMFVDGDEDEMYGYHMM